MNDKFTERLKYAFDNASMAEIARRIDVPHATIRNYFQGRMPSPEVLIKIANQTHVSLNWLLTGSGETFVDNSRRPDLDEILERRVTEIVDRKFADLRLGRFAGGTAGADAGGIRRPRGSRRIWRSADGNADMVPARGPGIS